MTNIDNLFEKIIMERGIHKRILSNGFVNLTSSQISGRIRSYRHRLKSGKNISIKTKVSVLNGIGQSIPELEYSKMDLISFYKFAMRQSNEARKNPLYLVEKWLANQKSLIS